MLLVSYSQLCNKLAWPNWLLPAQLEDLVSEMVPLM
jgi:hypothetical protein